MNNPFQEALTKGNPPPSAAGMLTRHEMDTQGKMFLKAPKTVVEAIIGSVIEDKEKVSAISAFIVKCKRFHLDSLDDPMMQWLMNHLAGWRAERGAALVFAMQTSIQAISEITTTSALGLKGADELAKHVKERRDKDKVEKGKVQD